MHAEEDELSKYRKMLKTGVPLGAVLQRAMRDGVDASSLDPKARVEVAAKEREKELCELGGVGSSDGDLARGGLARDSRDGAQ